jgi:hypothetical protein
MKPIYLALALLLSASAICRAGTPSLSVYQILRSSPASVGCELMMKVSNPPGQTYYVLGLSVSDVPYIVEIEKGGKWIAAPRAHALVEAQMRPFLPDSYLIFDVPVSFNGIEDITFRVRVFIYTVPDRERIYLESPAHTVVELVSDSFSSKDFRSLAPVSPPIHDPKSAGQ